MQIRRFRAPDMRQAIRKVRDAVGPDAVILSNQRLPTGEIEIVAALDYDGSLPSGMSSKRSPSPSEQDGPSADYLERIERAKQQVPPVENIKTPSSTEHRPTTQFEMPPISEDKTDPKVEEALSIRNAENAKQFRDMKLELENVRAMLELRQQASPQSDSKVNEIEIRAGDKLKSLGLSDFVVSRLIDDIDLQGREDDWNRLLAHLADYIPVRSGSSELRGCIAFMGPTGVGKTTSIGKIAAQHVLKHGSDGVVLITTDTYRIAAHEQLRTFGRILNVPVEVVNEYSDLNDVLAKYADYSLVLVDTAGMNPRDSNLERQLLMIKRARGNLKKLLVLPCTSQRQVLKTVIDVYSQVQLDGCVLSKLDESASLGEAISVVIEEGLPVVYIADGQRIPDDIEPARAHNLISRAVYTAEHYSQLYGSLKYGS
ncbi:flagellar biosynthesis protein FlhF [Marinomonas colpomeniae]|uniref:Flagellar biosynthesis protein FlhF n=1 Tax=Marinomonas colpomeniae TaxID=2774408 RepID=A0ABR8NW62_9GAMM|nr:flagellar biosynthesis protein FlhF [Marinomonas colpomeniae]MBD5769840.1 flagellar biosynthesis protein FlhF [Marinomonas colpomeniae]